MLNRKPTHLSIKLNILFKTRIKIDELNLQPAIGYEIFQFELMLVNMIVCIAIFCSCHDLSRQLHCDCTVKHSVGWVLVVLHFRDKPSVRWQLASLCKAKAF